MKKIKLLLVSAGSLVAQNLIEIIQHSRGAFHIVGTNCLEDFHTLKELDRFLKSPLTISPDFFSFLKSTIENELPDLVIPCRDEDAVALARLAEMNPGLRSKISLTDSQLAEKFYDKFLSYKMCEELGLPFAYTRLAKEYESNGILETPFILKPKKGFASKGVRLIVNPTQIDALNGSLEKFIVQERLGEDLEMQTRISEFDTIGYPLHFSFEENKYSIQIYSASDLSNSSYFIGKHFMKNGISYQVERWQDESLEFIARLSLEKFHKLGLRGPLNLQLQRSKDGDFKIFEFNCRFTGATSSRFLLGYNELDLLLKDHLSVSVFQASKTDFSKARKVIQTIGAN